MAQLIRPLGYTGNIQRLIWSQGNNVSVTAYLWGGGGGAGGNDNPGRGGSGSGSNFSQISFAVDEGDVIEVAVGGPGLGGGNATRDAGGGQAGFSLTENEIFNIRNFPIIYPPWYEGVFYPFSSNFGTFLNNNGTWGWPYTLGTFSQTYTVVFPEDGNYQFTGAASYNATFYLDDVQLFTADNRNLPFTVGYPVPAGTRTLRIIGTNRWFNFNNTGSLALTIGKGDSFSGGRGGNSGPVGTSGAGGGGGGATVVLKNGAVVGVAGGGGGGGGGGNRSPINGESAPGSRGQAPIGANPGQNGTSPFTDGGGGGGGGGGYGGGNGGYVLAGSYDAGGFAGSYGGTFGASTATPTGITPGGTGSLYYKTGTGLGGVAGGNGSGGYAAFLFDVNGIYVNTGSGFQAATNVWTKSQDAWKPVNAVYIKQDGVWEPVMGSVSPLFNAVVGRFGSNPRAASPDFTEISPDPPAPPSTPADAGGFDGGGGGGGGSKVICTALYQMGMMPEELYDHDQRFGKWLYENDPVAYKGYRKWADVLVEYMHGRGRPLLPKLMFWKTPEEKQELSHRIAVRVGNFVGYSFASEIARRAGHKVPFSLRGWLIVSLGLKICKAIGYAYGLHKSRKKK